MANEVAKAEKNDLRSLLEASMPKFQAVAPHYMNVERLVRLLLSAAGRNPKILQCSKESVLLFCMKCAETGLEPIGAGGAWPIPYENKKAGTTELTFIPDYRGLQNCALRAGCIVDSYAEVVRENDEFDYELGLNPSMVHKPARVDRGALESAYCVLVLPSGVKRFVVMTSDEIESIRNRSMAWNAFKRYGKECPWNTDEGEMFKKTVVRRAMKPFAGMSSELDSALKADLEADGMGAEQTPIEMPKARQELAEPTQPVDLGAAQQHDREPQPANRTKPGKKPTAAKSESSIDGDLEQLDTAQLADYREHFNRLMGEGLDSADAHAEAFVIVQAAVEA